MEDLKVIWHKLNNLQMEVGELIEMNKVETIYEKLKKEEVKRDKYKPLMIPMIGGTMLLLGGIIFSSNIVIGKPLDLCQLLGFLLILTGAIYLMQQYWANKILFNGENYSSPTISFFKMAKEKLYKRRKAAINAGLIYCLFLTVGIYLILIRYLILGGEGFFLGTTGLLFGIMSALAAITVQGQKKLFDKTYNDILLRIDKFLVE